MDQQEIIEILLKSKHDAQGFSDYAANQKRLIDFVNADASARQKLIETYKREDEALKLGTKSTLENTKAKDLGNRVQQDAMRLARAHEQALREDTARTNAAAEAHTRFAAQVKKAAEDATRAGQAMASAHDAALKQNQARLKETASEWDRFSAQVKTGLGIGAGFGVGVAAANALIGAIRGIPGALVETGQAINAVVQHGSGIEKIRQNFVALAASVNETAGSLINASRTASQGLVSDFEAMSAANKGILLGLPITAKEMELLTATSLALGRAMGRTATESLNDLILGLGRGSPRILDNIGIIVKAEDAYNSWARAHGRTVDSMTAAEKTVAVYNAALDASRVRLASMGEMTLTAGEQSDRARVQFRNTADELARLVATNPAVTELMKDIADGSVRAAETVQENREEISALVTWLTNSAIAYGGVAIAVDHFGTRLLQRVNNLRMFAEGLREIYKYLLLLKTEQQGFELRMQAPPPVARGQGSLEGRKVLGKNATVGGGSGADAIFARALGAADEDLSAEIKKAAADVKKATAAFLAKQTEAMKHANEAILRYGQAFVDAADDFRRGFGINDGRGGLRLATPGLGNFPGPNGTGQEGWSAATGWGGVGGQFGLAAAQSAHSMKYGASNEADAKRRADFLRRESQETNNWTDSLQNFAATMQLLGGNTTEAGRALGVFMTGLAALQQVKGLMTGKDGQKLSFGDLNAQNKLAVGTAGLGVGIGAYQSGSVAGGAMSGAAFGSQFGPWGVAIGAVAGGVLGHFGKAAKEKKELEALRKELTETYGSMDKVRLLGNAVGVSMTAAFSDKNPKAAKAAIEALQKALEKTKDELSGWERGVVSAQARAFMKADPDDPTAKAFLEKQRGLAVSGLSGAFGQTKDGQSTGGIRMVDAEDARAQATIASVVFWDTFKTEGLLKAAEAFKPITENLQTSLAAIGGDEAASAILGPIQQLIDLGTTNEAFRGATEGAQGLSETLTSMANRDIPMTVGQFGAFEQQAQSAYDQAKAGALEAGLTQEQAVNAAIMAAAPLLQALVESGQAYGMTLGEDTQALLGMASASGIAFKTDSTDRLILAINALTTTMGGIPPTFEAVGASAERAGAQGVTAATDTALAFGAIPDVVDASARNMAATWETGTDIVSLATEGMAGTIEKEIHGTGDMASQAFSLMVVDMAGSFGEMAGIAEVAVGDVNAVLAGLPRSWPIPITFPITPPDAGQYGFNYDGSADNDGDKTNSFASGTVNTYFPPRRGGHWINVSEGGKGEFVTVTHKPVTALADRAIITSKRVPRGVTHAAEGFGDMADLINGGAPPQDMASLVGEGGGGSELASAVEAIQEATASIQAAAEALAAAASSRSLTFNLSQAVTVRDESMIKTREGVEAFTNFFMPALDRELRLNQFGLRERIKEIVRSMQ